MDLKIEYINVDDLKPYERNARKHEEKDVQTIINSINEFGFNDPIGIWKDNLIIEGHGRLQAAKQIGMTEVPCVRLDHLTDEQRRAYALAHNKTAEMSDWDFELLDLELDDIEDIDMSDFGFEMTDIGGADNTVYEDEYTGEPPEEPKTKPGDIYQLGNHRLICGDSTDVNVIDRLMDGEKADMVFTDPPYGVGVSGGSGGKGENNRILGDLSQTSIPFSFDIAVNRATKDKAHFYFCGAESNLYMYQKLFDKYLAILPKHLIWVKNGFSMKQNGYHNQFEVIYFGYKRGSGGLWYGGRTEDEASDVWHINRDPTSTYLHPTQKPLGVPARAIKNSCPPNGSVIDLFGGSGSTLIACEQLNRKCYMAELDPKYCDVIVDRWEQFTGKKAVLLNV